MTDEVTKSPLCEAIRREVQVLPGDMPEEMWEAVSKDRDLAAEALRSIVRLTVDEVCEIIGKHGQTTISPTHLAYLRACEEEVEAERMLRATMEACTPAHAIYKRDLDAYTTARVATDAARAAWDAEGGQR